MKLTTLKPRLQVLRVTPYQMQETERLRGRAAVTRRERWLRLHPLCVDCQKEGRTTAAREVDHIVPLWKGGADDYDTNGQSLCRSHHEAKTKQEAAERAGGGR